MARATLLLVLLLLAAGCAGKPTPQAGPVASDPDRLPPGVENVLEGTVRGVDLLPIADVGITVSGVSDFQATDESGYYRFENLPPRDYIVTADKEGYRAKSQRALVADGVIYELNFTLEERPVAKPYNTSRDQAGFIACQLSVQTAPDNRQRAGCGDGLPNQKQVHDFTIDAGAVQLQIELHWTKRSDAARNLQLVAESLGSGAVTYGDETGGTGLKIVVASSLIEKTIPQGGKVRLSVHSAPGLLDAPSGPDVGVSFQQDYKVYVTSFFVEPGPQNFSALNP